jgi:hypothetical protein
MSTTVQGRLVSDWVSVSSCLAGRSELWEHVIRSNAFTVEVHGAIGRAGDIIVKELDGTLSVARYSDVGVA